MTSHFVSIDLGISASGYAYWQHGRLVQTGLIRARPKTKGLTGRIEEQRVRWGEICRELALLGGFEFTVIERMKHRPVYRRAGGKKGPYIDPQDLINLSLVSSVFGGKKYFVLPDEWKGTLDRDTEQSRSGAELDNSELALVDAVMPEGLRKEAWSAVGIGLSLLGRCHSCFTLDSIK